MADVLLIHPTGNQNAREAAKALAETGRLHAFTTALHIPSGHFPWKNMPSSIRHELGRRDFSETGGTVISASPMREAVRIVANKLGANFLTAHETGWSSVDQIYQAVDHYAARQLNMTPSIKAVYAYEDGALETFRAAKTLGVKCIYELPIGYWREHRRLNEDETLRQPTWAHTWSAIKDSPEKLARKDEEIRLADLIVVASSYTQSTLQAYPGQHAPVVMVPYGFPTISPTTRPWFEGKGPLKLLYVGGLSQRKGLSYMAEAVTQLGRQVSLSVIGSGPGQTLFKQHVPEMNYMGTLPHAAVLEQMRLHDVLLFPSLFEGFGMVITEAMSQGMVVLATNRTALPDIADHSSAICVPEGNTEAISEALKYLINTPSLVSTIGKAAHKRASSYRWSDYRKKLMSMI